MRILQRNLTHTTDTFLIVSHTTNVLLFKFRCNIFIGVRIIKEMPGLVASGTLCIFKQSTFFFAIKKHQFIWCEDKKPESVKIKAGCVLCNCYCLEQI